MVTSHWNADGRRDWPLNRAGANPQGAERHAAAPAVTEIRQPICPLRFSEGALVLLATTDTAAFAAVTVWLEAQVAGVAVCHDFGLAIAAALRSPARWSCMMVDLDRFGGIDETCDGLRHLRETVPQLPVILLSRRMRVNDYSTERLPICDVSLRLPLSPAALELALMDAIHNNLIWQGRHRAMREAV